MTEDILAQVHEAHALRYGTRVKPELRQSDAMRRLSKEARAVVTQHPVLMAYLSQKYVVTSLEVPPGSVDLGTWAVRRASEAGVVQHLYELAHLKEEGTDG